MSEIKPRTEQGVLNKLGAEEDFVTSYEVRMTPLVPGPLEPVSDSAAAHFIKYLRLRGQGPAPAGEPPVYTGGYTAGQLLKDLASLGACAPALHWLDWNIPKGHPAQEAWDKCPHGGWLLWLAGKADLDRHRLVLAACAVARRWVRFLAGQDDQVKLALENAEHWARGELAAEFVWSACERAQNYAPFLHVGLEAGAAQASALLAFVAFAHGHQLMEALTGVAGHVLQHASPHRVPELAGEAADAVRSVIPTLPGLVVR